MKLCCCGSLFSLHAVIIAFEPKSLGRKTTTCVYFHELGSFISSDQVCLNKIPHLMNTLKENWKLNLQIESTYCSVCNETGESNSRSKLQLVNA